MSNHYHIETESQAVPVASGAGMPRRHKDRTHTIPLAVRHVQRLTGATEHTARLLAELAGFSLLGGEADA